MPTPADPDQTCQKYNFQLKKQLASTATLALLGHWTYGCTKSKGDNYTCDNSLDNYRCNAAFFFVEGKLSCGAGGPIGGSDLGQSGPQPSGAQLQYQYLCGPNNTPTLSSSPTPPRAATRSHR